MPKPPTLGDRLKKAREDKGLTVRALAQAAKVSASTITKIERGQRQTRALVIQSLAQALGESETWLRDGTPDETSPPAPTLEGALAALARELSHHHDAIGKIIVAVETVRLSMDRGRADRLRRGLGPLPGAHGDPG